MEVPTDKKKSATPTKQINIDDPSPYLVCLDIANKFGWLQSSVVIYYLDIILSYDMDRNIC